MTKPNIRLYVFVDMMKSEIVHKTNSKGEAEELLLYYKSLKDTDIMMFDIPTNGMVKILLEDWQAGSYYLDKEVMHFEEAVKKLPYAPHEMIFGRLVDPDYELVIP